MALYDYQGNRVSDDNSTLSASQVSTTNNSNVQEELNSLSRRIAESSGSGTVIVGEGGFEPNDTYYGEKLSLTNYMRVDKIGSSVVLGKATVDGVLKAGQGMCVYNGYAFKFYDNGYMIIYDLTDNCRIVGRYKTAVWGNSYHCAVVCFGEETPSGYDFPVIYGSAGEGTHATVSEFWVMAVTESDSEVLQTITVENSEIGSENLSGVQCCVDNGYLWVKGRKSSTRQMFYYQYRLPKLSEGTTVTLTSSDMYQRFVHTEAHKAEDQVGQDWKIRGGMSIMPMGYGGSVRRVIYFTDIFTGRIASYIDMTKHCGEMEGVDIYNGCLYVSPLNNYICKIQV